MNNVVLFEDKWGVKEKIQKMGYAVCVFHHNKLVAEKKAYIHLPPNSVGEVFFKNISFELVGIVNTSDYYVESAAFLREQLNLDLPGLSLDQSRMLRDKLLLKRKLTQFSISTAEFSEIVSGKLSSLQLSFPFLIKPRKGVLAQGISVIRSEADFEAWKKSVKNQEDFYAEEYLRNVKEYCCDTIVANGKILAQFPGEYSITCLKSSQEHNGFGVNFPGFLAKEKIEELKAIVRLFIEKAKLKNGFGHFEFFYTSEGWKFGEVGWRLPGGYQLPTESYIANEDLLELYLKIFLKDQETPQKVVDTTNKFYGYFLYPKKAGKVKRITSDFNHSWIVESKIYVNEGETIEHEDSSVAMTAHVVYKADSKDDLLQKSQIVSDLFSIEYETPSAS